MNAEFDGLIFMFTSVVFNIAIRIERLEYVCYGLLTISFSSNISAIPLPPTREAVAGAKAINHQLSALLDHFFKLRTQDSSVVAIKRDMEPTWADGEKVVVELISSKMVPAKTG
jgi:hypothetical protein